MSAVLVNCSYATQRVTGQQRYATEVTNRLVDSGSFRALTPNGFWARSGLRVWAWVQLLLPALAGRGVVLSMTSRAPLWRRRHVLVVHDLFVLTNPEWYSRRYIWTHAPLLRAQIRSAAAVVAVSQPVAEQVAALRADPVEVAPNAPSDVFRRRPEEGVDNSTLKALGLEADSYFLAVGSKDPRKNLRRLAAAYGQLSEEHRRRFPLVVVGGANAIFRDQEIAWPPGTVDAGYIPDDELRQLYRHARSVVFVSKAEGFGLPLVEAAAAGARGLLVSDIDVFRWICGDRARYVDPTSIDEIAVGLGRELAAPQNMELDVERFTWDSTATVVGDACRRVVADV